MNNKKCSKCGVEKPATKEFFNKCRNSLQSWCKECKRENHLKNKEERNKKSSERYRKLNPEVKRKVLNDGTWEPVEKVEKGMKKCATCEEIKPMTDEYFQRLSKAKDGFRYSCKECRKLEYNGYSEQAKENNKRRYKMNKEKILQQTKQYRIDNEEWYKSYNKSYYEENKERIKRKTNNYYHLNKEKMSLKQKVYRYKWNHSEKGKELKRQYQQKRRSQKDKAINTLTIEEWNKAKEYFNHECAYCGTKKKNFHQEHVIPLSKGGAYNKQNIIPSCQRCNNIKWAHDMEEWYQSQPFFSQKRLNKIHKWIGVDKNNKSQQLSIL